MSSVRREEHNLTTREALQLFEAAGLPRNQRSIERYCADGKLDAFFDSDEQRYYISRASVDRLIGQLTEIKTRHQAINAVGPAVSDGIRPATTSTRQDRNEQQESTDHADRKELQIKLASLEDDKKKLEEKNFTLSYEKKASEQMVTMMREQLKEDRKEFFEQMDKLVKEIGETKQLVGELQTQLKQIAAPRTDSQSGATTGMRQITEAEVVDDNPPTTPSDTLSGRSHPFHPTVVDVRESNSGERV
jgi:chromosome segregation ATPase